MSHFSGTNQQPMQLVAYSDVLFNPSGKATRAIPCVSPFSSQQGETGAMTTNGNPISLTSTRRRWLVCRKSPSFSTSQKSVRVVFLLIFLLSTTGCRCKWFLCLPPYNKQNISRLFSYLIEQMKVCMNRRHVPASPLSPKRAIPEEGNGQKPSERSCWPGTR